MASLEKRDVWLPLSLRCEGSFSSKLQWNLGGRMLLAPYQWVWPGKGSGRSGAGFPREELPAAAGNSYAAEHPMSGAALVLCAVVTS